MPIFIKQDGTQQNYTNEQWAIGSNMAALNYVSENEDVQNHAVATAASLGIAPDNPEYAVTIANIGKEHFARYGRTEVSRNSAGKTGTNIMFRNLGYSMVDQADAVGATPNLVYQGSMADRFIQETPRADATKNPDTVVTNEELANRAGGGSDGNVVVPPGGGNVVVPPGGGNVVVPPGGGIMSEPVDLAPIQSAISGVAGSIGTPTTAQTNADQTTLMGQTAGLATGQQGIRDVVNPIGEQVTALQSAVTPLATNVGEIKTGVTGLETNVGTSAANTGLYAPISNLQGDVTGISSAIGTQADGQPNLLTGQKDLTTDVGNVQQGVTNLTTNMGAPTVGGPQTLFEGQGLMQKGIGQEAVKNPDGVVTTPATGLFAGQSGLMTGQTGLTRGIEGLGTQLGDSQRTLEGQIGRFQTAAEQYQRGATTQRGSIEGNQISNQQAMLNQVQGVGQPLNRQADMLATQRAQEAASFAASQAPLQSQIATLTANNANQAANNQPIGPLGPMAADPRDALIQQLLTRNASLMNNRPV